MTEITGPEIPFPFPSSRSRDGGSYPSAPPGHTEGMGRAKYQATRLGTTLFITAEGQLPYTNQIADIRQLPWRIFPPQFGMFYYTPEITLPAIRPFRFTERFGFPLDTRNVVIHDADGAHEIDIVDTKAQTLSFMGSADGAGSSTDSDMTKVGYGVSLQEAFDNAVKQLPSGNGDIADGFVIYTALELGRFRGGIAGLDSCYAKVQAKFGVSGPR